MPGLQHQRLDVNHMMCPLMRKPSYARELLVSTTTSYMHVMQRPQHHSINLVKVCKVILNFQQYSWYLLLILQVVYTGH